MEQLQKVTAGDHHNVKKKRNESRREVESKVFIKIMSKNVIKSQLENKKLLTI